jgi:DNA transformation protein
VAISAEFRDRVIDLFAPFGEVTFKRFFSGAGIYFNDVIFAFIVRERIYLRASPDMRADFEAERAGPFTFKNGKGETVVTGFFEIPERLLDDPDDLAKWARRSYEAALVAKGKKKSKAKRPSSKSSPPSDLPLVAPRKSKKKPVR